MLHTTTSNNQTDLETKIWLKKSRYILAELYICAMHHCTDSRFFLSQSNEKLYPTAQLLAQDLSQWLAESGLPPEKINLQPFVELLRAGATNSQLAELVERFQVFFEESLENGFNAPSLPVQQILKLRFEAYMQAARLVANGLSVGSSEEKPAKSVLSRLKLFSSWGH